jgi:hypothetical protein
MDAAENDKAWHVCGVSVDIHGVPHEACDYKTKNRNAMRVHLRTIHSVYYCGYCRKRWIKCQKQMWKAHDCRKALQKAIEAERAMKGDVATKNF